MLCVVIYLLVYALPDCSHEQVATFVTFHTCYQEGRYLSVPFSILFFTLLALP